MNTLGIQFQFTAGAGKHQTLVIKEKLLTFYSPENGSTENRCEIMSGINPSRI